MVCFANVNVKINRSNSIKPLLDMTQFNDQKVFTSFTRNLDPGKSKQIVNCVTYIKKNTSSFF